MKIKGNNECPKCGVLFEACYLCRRDERHQRCVKDDMCHDCIMLEKYGEPKEAPCQET